QPLGRLLKRLPAGSQGQLIRLATLWGSKSFARYANETSQAMLAAVADEQAPEADRIASAQQLIGFRADDPQVVQGLLDAVSPKSSPSLSAGIIETLGESESNAVGPALVERVGRLVPSARAAAFRVLLRRPKSTAVLLNGIDKGQVALTDLTLDQK